MDGMDRTGEGSGARLDVEYVDVAGDLDAGTAELARSALLMSSAATVVADLRDLSFCDSAGLAVLLHVRLILEEEGRSLALAKPPRQFEELIQLAGVKHSFAIVE